MDGGALVRRYRVDELRFQLPDGWVDRSVQTFTRPGHDGPDAMTLTVAREPLGGDALDAYVTRRLAAKSAGAPRVDVVSRRDRTIAGVACAEARLQSESAGAVLFHREVYVPHRDSVLVFEVKGPRHLGAACDAHLERALSVLRFRDDDARAAELLLEQSSAGVPAPRVGTIAHHQFDEARFAPPDDWIDGTTNVLVAPLAGDDLELRITRADPIVEVDAHAARETKKLAQRLAWFVLESEGWRTVAGQRAHELRASFHRGTAEVYARRLILRTSSKFVTFFATCDGHERSRCDELVDRIVSTVELRLPAGGR